MTKNLISRHKQGRRALKVLSIPTLEQVMQRLQVEVPDLEADNTYKLKDINEATVWVLSGRETLDVACSYLPRSTLAPATTTPPATEPQVKKEDMHALIEAFTKMANTFAHQSSVPAAIAPAPPRPVAQVAHNPGGMGAAGNLCHYCSLAGHNMNTCPAVKEDIVLGRICRNEEGRIVLPGGGFILRSMAGNNMCERVMNWH